MEAAGLDNPFSPDHGLVLSLKVNSPQSLARTKTRSYGSTATVTAPLGEKYIVHRVTDSDTLQGIALKYGVTMEQIKGAQELDNRPSQPEELSAKDFLHRLDLQIKISKQAARKLKEEVVREDEDAAPISVTSYQEIS